MLTSDSAGKRVSLEAGNYTVSGGGNKYTIQVIDSNGTLVAQVATNETEKTFTLTGTTEVYIRLSVASGNSFNNETVYIMLESGLSASTWEPYTGGMAAPNPLYPQDLHVISGENSITVSNKNLFDGILYNGQIGNNGSWASSTTRITNVNQTVDNILPIKAGTYTLSIENLNYCTLLTKDDNGNILENYAGSWNALPFTFTLTQNGYLYFTGRKTDNSTITASDYSVQLEKGSTATAYVPHQETTYPIDLEISGQPIEYCKIGNYKDRFFKNLPSDPDYLSWAGDGIWIYKKRIGKIDMANNANFDDVDNYTDYYSFTNNNPVQTYQTPAGQNYATSNYFSPYYSYPTCQSNLGVYASSIVINMDARIGITTTADLNTWLTNNNPTAYVKIYDPYHQYDILIEGGDLAAQLEAVYNAIAYDGGTIISQTNDDLAFDITASTIQKVSN